MAGRGESRAVDSRLEWQGRVAVARSVGRRKPAITVGRIVEAALVIVEREGYDAFDDAACCGGVADRAGVAVCARAHKNALEGLLVGVLMGRLSHPVPDPACWEGQVLQVCAQLRDQYLRYPGIARAALSAAALGLDALRVSESLLAIVLAGGVAPRDAAWANDAMLLYVGAYCLEASLHRDSVADTDGEWSTGRRSCGGCSCFRRRSSATSWSMPKRSPRARGTIGSSSPSG